MFEDSSYDRLKKMPLFKKAQEIMEISLKISESVSMHDDDKLSEAEGDMLEARELSTYCSGLAMCGYKNTDYLQLLRDEVEEFRVLFAEWVKTFDQWDYIIDRWGLFNPPGIDYDTHDPDDDIPFDSPFDSEEL